MKWPIVLSIIFLLSGQSISQENWQKIFNRYANKVVTISYFERLLSFEEIEDKEKVKRYLTGIVVDDQGLILTSSAIYPANIEFTSSPNLVASAQLPTAIKVKFNNGLEKAAEFVGKDDDLGVAFIRLKDSVKTDYVHFKRQKALVIGQKILLFHHLPESYDFVPIMVERRINALSDGQQHRYYFEKNFLSLGNFGLVIDQTGQAIGYFRANRLSSGRNLPFSEMNRGGLAQVVLYPRFAAQVVNPPFFQHKKTVRKKWLGIYMQPFTRDLARYFGQPNVKGVLVNTVIKNSPAEAAGLLPGDVITKINDLPLQAERESDLENFRQMIRNQTADTVTIEIFRQNHFLLKKVNLRGSPISQFMAEEVANPELGFSVKELTRDIILSKNLEADARGVWVSRVERAGWADIAGLQIGDLIKAIDDTKIQALSDVKNAFERISKEKPPYVKLFIQHGGSTHFLFIKTNYQIKQRGN